MTSLATQPHEPDRSPVAILFGQVYVCHVARAQAAARALAATGREVLALETTRSNDAWWPPSDRCDGLIRRSLFQETNYSQLTNVQICRRAVEALEELQPGAVVVLGWAFPESLEALRWCRLNDRAAVIVSESKADDSPRRRLSETIKRRIIGLADSMLVGGRPHRDYAIELGMPPDRVFLGCDVVDNDYFRAATDAVRANPAAMDRRAMGLPDGPFWLTSNRFIPRKNLPALLDAYAHYRQAVGADAWALVLLGDGEQRPLLEAKIHRENIDGVWLPGYRPIDQLPNYYGLAEAFIHPALNEQWGLVVNEAMASGLPVLVSRTVGCRYDLVKDGENGFLFDPTSTDEIAGAMVRFHRLSESQRRQQAQASRRIIAEWPADRFGRGLLQAVDAGLRHSRQRRGRSLSDRISLLGLRWLARRIRFSEQTFGPPTCQRRQPRDT